MQEQKKPEVHYSNKARRDLDAIWDIYIEEYQNVDAAVKMIDAITGDIERLSDFPKLGPLLSSIADVGSAYRFLVTGKYLSFYRIDGSDIYIDRVLYGGRDYLSVLLDSENE